VSDRSDRPTGSIRRRATLAVLLVAGVSVAVVFGVFYFAWTSYTLSVRATELKSQARIIASGLDAGGLPGGAADTAGTRARLMRVEAGLIGAQLSVTDAKGRVLFSTTSDSVLGTYPVRELEPDDSSGGVLSSGVRTLAGVGTVLVVAAELDIPDRYLVAAQPVREINQTQGRVVALLALSALAALAAAWATGAWLARRITGPVVRLTTGARAIAAGDWGHQVAVEGDDEVSELAHAFNVMSERVSEAYRAQKEFVGDVSHELRTPITSIRGFSGALLDGTIADDAGRDRALLAIHDEAGRISELASTLLSLAELDAGGVELACAGVDVGALAETLVARFSGRAADTRRDLEVGPLAGTPVGDGQRLLQAVSALVDNALEHTPEGGRVRVTAAEKGGRWRLEVDDSGPGIPAADRARIFGRFTRLDPSRSSSAGGSGLGLAICHRIVELMGGRVWVEESDLGGARFVIELSVAQGAPGST
jgi:signal transduction histidine kinase